MTDIEERIPLLAPNDNASPDQSPSTWWAQAWQWLKTAARSLKREMVALWVASSDPRVPLYAKVLATVVLALALSPFDIIPDFIPVLGLVDDLILVPLGLWLALRFIPEEVMVDARRTAEEMEEDGSARLPPNYYAAVIIIMLWVATAALLGNLAWRLWKGPLIKKF